MWKKPTNQDETLPPPRATTSPEPSRKGSGPAVIGPSIRIKGDVSGQEDLVVEGSIEGEISLKKNNVVIGRSGKAKADVYGKTIRVEGQVDGNLFGSEAVVLHASGSVSGNITAPKVTLENGATFKGSIDMASGQGTPSLGAPVSATGGQKAGGGSGASGNRR